jgi:hypothetical protein
MGHLTKGILVPGVNQAAIKGYNVTYNNGDHHILEVEMDLDTTILENTVTVFGETCARRPAAG